MKPDFNDTIHLMRQRFSCRLYDTRPVGADIIEKLLEAARIAPSACNRQPWRFVVVESPELRDAVCAAYEREWARTAPLFIVACGVHDEAWHRPDDGKDHTDVDLSIAIEHICLAATSLGLGSCWICNFNPGKLRSALSIPEGIEPIAIIPVGYPAEGISAPEKKRKPLSEITVWGKF